MQMMAQNAMCGAGNTLLACLRRKTQQCESRIHRPAIANQQPLVEFQGLQFPLLSSNLVLLVGKTTVPPSVYVQHKYTSGNPSRVFTLDDQGSRPLCSYF